MQDLHIDNGPAYDVMVASAAYGAIINGEDDINDELSLADQITRDEALYWRQKLIAEGTWE